ncbi:MAG: hypothetical protein RJA70_3918 [Pseudomonadota bacterium]|jgi:ribonuclease HI
MPTFDCAQCGAGFSVPQTSLDKYPGWQPKVCRQCKEGTGGNPGASKAKSAARSRPSRAASETREADITVAEVLAKYADGPDTGVFTDGAASPNPGPGGWGAVYVRGGTIVQQTHGAEDHTTNNRMELVALLYGCALVPAGEPATVFTDSQLCVNTVTQWAKGWEKNGWKRKTGEIKNLELVKQLYRLLQARPELEVRWIRAHSGTRWNEYADALATAYRRESL